jgi:hypothetical protein
MREEGRKPSDHSPLPLLQGRWEGMFFLFLRMGLIFTTMPLWAINEPRWIFIYKDAIKVTNGPQILYC